MRQYETAFLIAPNLPEEERESLILQMAEVISKRKGKMTSQDSWGMRKLAYPIKKFEEAYYVFFNYEGEADIPVELERLFKQKEAIIRYLTLKKDLKENKRKKIKGKTKPEETDVIKETEPQEETKGEDETVPIETETKEK
ncbi:MAG: 30S ribosomal protein S6 [Acidobacteriota bacterium]|nr:30S ribosomal protein S6 [Acidobacteriota bacterium]